MNLSPTFDFSATELLQYLRINMKLVEAGVSVEGPAAAYAEVWEWGNVRQTKQGPRTVLGVNPNGESIWMSSQAPRGYIRTNDSAFMDAVKIELEKVPSFDKETIEKSAKKIVQEIANIIAEHAPVDTGQLRSSFEVVEPGDPLLRGDEAETDRVLNIGGMSGE